MALQSTTTRTPPREVVVLAGVRTAIGKYGGGLKDVPPADLAAQVTREAVARAGVDASEVGHVVFGHVIHTEARDMYLARAATINAGLPVETPALTVNRLCGSGLQAIISAAQTIALGDADVAVAGGTESMSRAQYWLPGLRWGQRMGDGGTVDAMVAALTDPFDDCHMGVTAENIAEKWSITREDQDALAIESHRRAAAAIADGRFVDQILPVEIKGRKSTTVFAQDEHVRADITLGDLAKLRPAFADEGSVTADSHVGVEPRYMGIGPVPAVLSVLAKAGLALSDIDVFEVNEAFAVQALAVARDLGLPAEKTNPNGSGVGLGHPLGATGAILTVKALYELARIGGRYGLVTMCIGGGQGIAAIFERA